MSDINEVIGRAIADEGFRAELLADPAAANDKYTLGLDGEQISKLSELDSATIEAALSGEGTDLSAE